MKFECQVNIQAPIEKVTALIQNVDYFPEWQDGFQSIELLEGTKGQAGAISKISFLDKTGKMELIETIIENDLPHYRLARYDHKHMSNTLKTIIEGIGESQTRLIYSIHYTAFYSFLPKMIAKFFPGMFKKQTQKWLNQFKVLAEKT